MTWWHRVGQRVVCVDNQPRPGDFNEQSPSHLDLGRVYVVSLTCLTINTRGDLGKGFCLEGFSQRYAFARERFRPATDISSLQAIAEAVTKRGKQPLYANAERWALFNDTGSRPESYENYVLSFGTWVERP